MAVSLQQLQYRFRSDTSDVNTAATFPVALNTTWQPEWVPFRIRFTIQSVGTTSPSTQTYNLEVSKNSGAYAVIGGTTGVLASITASSSTQAESITSAQLTAGTGTFLAGQYVNTGDTATFVLTHGDYTEIEYGILLDITHLNNADTLDFRVYGSSTGALTTYTVTPRITVLKIILTGVASTTSTGSIISTVSNKLTGVASTTSIQTTIPISKVINTIISFSQPLTMSLMTLLNKAVNTIISFSSAQVLNIPRNISRLITFTQSLAMSLMVLLNKAVNTIISSSIQNNIEVILANNILMSVASTTSTGLIISTVSGILPGVIDSSYVESLILEVDNFLLGIMLTSNTSSIPETIIISFGVSDSNLTGNTNNIDNLYLITASLTTSLSYMININEIVPGIQNLVGISNLIGDVDTYLITTSLISSISSSNPDQTIILDSLGIDLNVNLGQVGGGFSGVQNLNDIGNLFLDIIYTINSLLTLTNVNVLSELDNNINGIELSSSQGSTINSNEITFGFQDLTSISSLTNYLSVSLTLIVSSNTSNLSNEITSTLSIIDLTDVNSILSKINNFIGSDTMTQVNNVTLEIISIDLIGLTEQISTGNLTDNNNNISLNTISSYNNLNLSEDLQINNNILVTSSGELNILLPFSGIQVNISENLSSFIQQLFSSEEMISNVEIININPEVVGIQLQSSSSSEVAIILYTPKTTYSSPNSIQFIKSLVSKICAAVYNFKPTGL